ncbi:MAG: ABC transporter ATP-binding protein [Bryobacteraceae bacterium]
MIRVEHLTKRFGELRAADDLSFEVPAGETFALLGPNGSGKTTTIKCLVGLALPTAGEIYVDGIAARREPVRARLLTSYLPQRVTFEDHLTAREVLEFYCRLRKLPPERVDWAIERFHFGADAGRLIKQFSGGMTQRLGLAVASLPDAPVLILDEPTVSLDPRGAADFRDSLTEVKQSGKTILFSTHVFADVEQLADRVGILINGRLMAVETIDALRTSAEAGCRMFVRVEEAARWIGAARLAGAAGASVDGSHLVVTAPAGLRLDILKALQTAGAIVAGFHTEQPSLERIYMRYVEKHDGSRRLPDPGEFRVRDQAPATC